MQNNSTKAGNYALDKFSNFGSCSQAVLLGVQQIYPEIYESTITAAHAFGSGGADFGEGACGALVGGMLAISSIFGRTPKLMGSSDFAFNTELSRQLIEKFTHNFSAHTCQDFQKIIHGKTFDLWQADQAKICKDVNFKNNCKNLVQKITEWTVEIIQDNYDKYK